MKPASPMKLIYFALILLLVGCASGTSIAVGDAKDEIDSSQVKLYLEAPETYETVGLVKASSNSGWTDQGTMDYAIEELKDQAAKLGANGVIIESTDIQKTATLFSSDVTGYVAGKAIYVP